MSRFMLPGVAAQQRDQPGGAGLPATFPGRSKRHLACRLHRQRGMGRHQGTSSCSHMDSSPEQYLLIYFYFILSYSHSKWFKDIFFN